MYITCNTHMYTYVGQIIYGMSYETTLWTLYRILVSLNFGIFHFIIYFVIYLVYSFVINMIIHRKVFRTIAICRFSSIKLR